MNCRFCGKALSLVPDSECPKEWSVRLEAMVKACDSCGDYFFRRGLLADSIQKTTTAIHLAQQFGIEREKLEKRILRLDMLTKQFSIHVCKHLKIPYIEGETWMPDFPRQCTDKPDRCFDTLNAFVNLLRDRVRVARASSNPRTNDP